MMPLRNASSKTEFIRRPYGDRDWANFALIARECLRRFHRREFAAGSRPDQQLLHAGHAALDAIEAVASGREFEPGRIADVALWFSSALYGVDEIDLDEVAADPGIDLVTFGLV